MPAKPPRRKTDRMIDACMERLDTALDSLKQQSKATKRGDTPATQCFSPARYKKTKQQLMALTEDEALFDSDDEQFVAEHDAEVKKASSRVKGSKAG